MSIDWNGNETYETHEPIGPGSPSGLPRFEARRLFKERMKNRHARIEMLRRLVAAGGVVLGSDDAAVQDLNDWFAANIEADPENPGFPSSECYSVCHDMALFLGEVMIERHPNLYWEFFTWGKKSVSFQRQVLMGLSTEDPKFRTNIDIDGMVVGSAHEVLGSQGSIPTYGLVEIKGHLIDIDSTARRPHRSGAHPRPRVPAKLLVVRRAVSARVRPPHGAGIL
ncbi:hypothetical protein [Sanguibacter antarcticus]|uniref:Uncharacterized protein n=1 Tax=Sanguibacter antarcticus TaxID=372484 RepID=A0A2A9E916_9MICO|nr:hypothetical protein [Sanguibacter antarcticus]PFG34815.1 hypothetical protein ATL42_2741 [Sanguibacter antarcticus]